MTAAAPAGTETFGDFDFGLSADAEQRARVLHEQAIVVDLLCQGPCGYRAFTEPLERELAAYLADTSDILARFTFAGELLARHALATGDDRALEECWRASGVTAGTRERDFVSAGDILKGLAFANAQFDRFPWFVRANHPDHIRAAKERGLIAGFINSQETLGFGTDLELFENARYFGLAMVQLTYNSTNFVGTGCMEPSDAGLTPFGRQFVSRANDLGVIVDVSHCAPRTTLDACAASTRPIVASHTSARALYDQKRAKSDEGLKAIAATGGVIGVYAVPFFLSADPGASVEVMLDHVEYIAQLVGWEHVGIGADWPMQMPKSAIREIFRDSPFDYTRTLVGFDDFRDYPNVTRGLVARGYGDEQIRGILGENFLRVFGEVAA